MSEFHNGTFATLLSHKRYISHLEAIGEHQDSLAGEPGHHDCATFYVRREDKSIKIDVSPIFYHCACIVEEDHFGNASEPAQDSAAVYMSSSAHIIPSARDIGEFVSLAEDRPELIRGFITMAALGINRLFLRRAEGRSIDPAPIEALEQAPHIQGAVELLGETGLNWFVQGPIVAALPHSHDTRLFR